LLSVPLLDLTDISKNFGAIQALNNVSLTLEHGEVVGLMGDTGAGKSTLMRIIAGNFPPTQGTITIDGRPTVFHKPVEAGKAGVELVYQDLALCDMRAPDDRDQLLRLIATSRSD
jgi:simple sugar transport system ATP-binding protein